VYVITPAASLPQAQDHLPIMRTFSENSSYEVCNKISSEIEEFNYPKASVFKMRLKKTPAEGLNLLT